MIIKEQIISEFNRGARTYDSAAGLQAKIALSVAERFQGRAASQILEVGCGTGLLSQYLLRYFPQANLVLVDIAPTMIDVCQQRLGHAQQIKLLCADGEALPLKQSFDLIVSSMTMHWFTQPVKSLQQLCKQLKQNGRFIFAMLGCHSLIEWQRICFEFRVPHATPLFPKIDTLFSELPDFTFESKLIKQRYHNIKDFLTSFKLLGATTPRKDYVSLNAGKLREIMRAYNNELDITYEVIYGEYHLL